MYFIPFQSGRVDGNVRKRRPTLYCYYFICHWTSITDPCKVFVSRVLTFLGYLVQHNIPQKKKRYVKLWLNSYRFPATISITVPKKTICFLYRVWWRLKCLTLNQRSMWDTKYTMITYAIFHSVIGIMAFLFVYHQDAHFYLEIHTAMLVVHILKSLWMIIYIQAITPFAKDSHPYFHKRGDTFWEKHKHLSYINLKGLTGLRTNSQQTLHNNFRQNPHNLL